MFNFFGGKKSPEGEGYGFIASPGEAGENISDEEMSLENMKAKLHALEQTLGELEEKRDSLGEGDTEMLRDLPERIQNLKESIKRMEEYESTHQS